MDSRYIYLIFTRTNTWLSRAIYTISKMEYVHSSLSFDDSFTRMYSFGRVKPENPFSGGFVQENLYDGIYKRFSNSKCMISRIKVTKEQYESLEKEINMFLNEKDKYKYNFIGLFGALLNISIKRQRYYFCSQFVSEVLIKSNVLFSEKEPQFIRPDELYRIENKEVIYEGIINERLSLQDKALVVENTILSSGIGL